MLRERSRYDAAWSRPRQIALEYHERIRLNISCIIGGSSAGWGSAGVTPRTTGLAQTRRRVSAQAATPQTSWIRSAPVAEDGEWLDADAAARYLNFHPNTIYRMVRDGQW